MVKTWHAPIPTLPLVTEQVQGLAPGAGPAGAPVHLNNRPRGFNASSPSSGCQTRDPVSCFSSELSRIPAVRAFYLWYFDRGNTGQVGCDISKPLFLGIFDGDDKGKGRPFLSAK